jgi:NAD(P)-dependent dehydrogenase (short-subunit alcohol dehydrogenase family)
MSSGLLKMGGGVEAIAKENPLRKLGKPEDIAGIVVFLCSRAGAHVNAETIAIDGGAVWARGELQSKL